MFRKRSFFRPFDAVCLILVAAAAAWGFLSFGVAEGSKVVVYLAEKKYAWYDLGGEKRRIQVPTRIGPVWLEIGGGEARVAESPCPNKICVKTGRVRHAHGEIICVPAHLLVAIEGASGGKEGGVDAVTF
jgi:hypothetical protein